MTVVPVALALDNRCSYINPRTKPIRASSVELYKCSEWAFRWLLGGSVCLPTRLRFDSARPSLPPAVVHFMLHRLHWQTGCTLLGSTVVCVKVSTGALPQ